MSPRPSSLHRSSPNFPLSYFISILFDWHGYQFLKKASAMLPVTDSIIHHAPNCPILPVSNTPPQVSTLSTLQMAGRDLMKVFQRFWCDFTVAFRQTAPQNSVASKYILYPLNLVNLSGIFSRKTANWRKMLIRRHPSIVSTLSPSCPLRNLRT